MNFDNLASIFGDDDEPPTQHKERKPRKTRDFNNRNDKAGISKKNHKRANRQQGKYGENNFCKKIDNLNFSKYILNLKFKKSGNHKISF